jgi:hypothetical protein
MRAAAAKVISGCKLEPDAVGGPIVRGGDGITTQSPGKLMEEI